VELHFWKEKKVQNYLFNLLLGGNLGSDVSRKKVYRRRSLRGNRRTRGPLYMMRMMMESVVKGMQGNPNQWLLSHLGLKEKIRKNLSLI
jgi:hypothetical protein